MKADVNRPERPTGQRRLPDESGLLHRNPFALIRFKRNYQAWVANETMEDYALRYAARSYRRWHPMVLANTALGGISFLALEAIGGAITLSYGFHNAVTAIIVVSMIIFLTNLPIAYYSARYHIDIDLLTRGAGFGYVGSTITSLIYASFTFIFFALEAAIMAQALRLYFNLPIVIGYVFSSLVIIPITFFGVTLITRLQLWTQPPWIILLALPFLFILYKDPGVIGEWTEFTGRSDGGFDLLMFGAATGVLFALVVQIGEQVDYLRFLPDLKPENRRSWWLAMVSAGPGWIGLGGLKVIAGSLLAFIAIKAGLGQAQAIEPIHMYIKAYQYVFDDAAWVLLCATVFVILSQIKINVTNAYAGSLAWSNFFSRVAHYHPGRVVWLVFNVIIALLLMLLGIFETLEAVLTVYSNVAIAWIGAIVADLVVLKPLGVSPPYPEFKRAHLYNYNPVGCGAMLIASVLSISAYAGLLGEVAAVYSAFISLFTAFGSAVLIGIATRGRYYLARSNGFHDLGEVPERVRCCVCELDYEPDDIATCPFYEGPICSLCCSLDNHCHDVCKSSTREASFLATESHPSLQQRTFRPNVKRRLGWFLSAFSIAAVVTGVFFLLAYRLIDVSESPAGIELAEIFLRLYLVALVLVAVGAWWVTLSYESRELAERELVNSLHYLEMTRRDLVESEKLAALGGLVAGVAHEVNTPVGIMVSAASFLDDRTRAIDRLRAQQNLSAEELENYLADAEESSRLLLSNARRTAHLINNFKQLATDQLREERRWFNLRDYIEETLASLRSKLKATRIEVRVDCPADLRLYSQPGPFAQVLTNLLLNSLTHAYRPEQYGMISIAVEPDETGGNVKIHFTDDGCGMPESVRSRVFEPFFTTRRHQGGTGLGLHLVYTIVTQKLSGSIAVDSEPGHGTRFILRLPCVSVAGEHRPHPDSRCST